MILSYHLNAKWTFQSKRRNLKGLFVFLSVSLPFIVSYPPFTIDWKHDIYRIIGGAVLRSAELTNWNQVALFADFL
jgi:hypothetical protein